MNVFRQERQRFFEGIDGFWHDLFDTEYALFDVKIDSPAAFLLQSKAVMALIWGLHEEQHSFFTEEEHEWIHTYFLPTYLDNDYFIEQGISYVKKPSFGREGDTVEIFFN